MRKLSPEPRQVGVQQSMRRTSQRPIEWSKSQIGPSRIGFPGAPDMNELVRMRVVASVAVSVRARRSGR